MTNPLLRPVPNVPPRLDLHLEFDRKALHADLERAWSARPLPRLRSLQSALRRRQPGPDARPEEAEPARAQ